MTTPSTGGPHPESISVELANLRGDVREGFAQVRGQLELISQAQNATAQDLSDLEARVSDLEARRLPLAPLAAMSGVVSALVAVIAVLL